MNSRVFTISVALLMPWGALAQNDNPYADLNKQVQEKLQERGFYSGPVNGIIGSNTQAAIAQFQLSIPMPASGMVDDTTLAALGIAPRAPASAGASGDTAAGTVPRQSAGDSTERPSADLATPDRRLGGSCDALVGLEKESCLKRGGTVEASAPASSGASAPSQK